MIFNQVRVPRENLLNRFSDVTEAGEFFTDIQSPDQRFGLMLGALGSGRICVIFAATGYLEACVKIALRFSAMRQ